jgi:hypothetical protein
MQSCMAVHAIGRQNLQQTAVTRGLDGVIQEKRKGAITVGNEPAGPGDQETVSAWKNIGKIIFLIAALAAAWFVLERLIGGK